MKSITLAVLTLAMSSPVLSAPQAEGPIPRSASRAGIGRLVPEITVTDVDGDPVGLAPVGDERATVIALTSTTCPLSLKFAPLLGRLSTADAARATAVVEVVKEASLQDPTEEVNASWDSPIPMRRPSLPASKITISLLF